MPTPAEIEAHIALIDTAIMLLVTGRVKSYTIGRRTFTRYSLIEMRGIRQMYVDMLSSVPVEEISVYDDTDL